MGLSRVFPKVWHCIVASGVLGLMTGYGVARNVVDPGDRDALRRCLAELKPRPEVQVVFRKLHLDAREPGAAESIAGKLRFSVSVDGELKGEYAARVRVPAGGEHASSDPGVEAPLGYVGPFNQQAFNEDAVRYIRRALSTCETPRDRLAGSTVAVDFAADWTTTFRAAPPPGKPSGAQ